MSEIKQRSLALILIAMMTSSVSADLPWNQFRGPRGDGKSTEKNLPVEFDEAKNVRWKVPIPDESWSSPVVWGNEIWLTTGSDERKELRAICVDLENGKIFTDIKVFDMIERKVDTAYTADSPHLNSPATPTPVVEADRVFVSFGSQGIACLDRKTGEKLWPFATATLIEVNGGPQLIAPAAEATISYIPDTGEELWRVLHPGGFNVAARPIYASGMVYVFTSGLNCYLMGIRPDGRGDVTDTHVAWSTNKGTPNIPSPVVVEDGLFMVTDKAGIARCLDARTGDELWKKRLGGDHWASPLYADGKLYFSSKRGDVTVLPASKEEPEILARNKMSGSFIASPAVAGDSLILRSTTHLYCIANGYTRTAVLVAADQPRPSAKSNQLGKAKDN